MEDRTGGRRGALTESKSRSCQPSAMSLDQTATDRPGTSGADHEQILATLSALRERGRSPFSSMPTHSPPDQIRVFDGFVIDCTEVSGYVTR